MNRLSVSVNSLSPRYIYKKQPGTHTGGEPKIEAVEMVSRLVPGDALMLVVSTDRSPYDGGYMFQNAKNRLLRRCDGRAARRNLASLGVMIY